MPLLETKQLSHTYSVGTPFEHRAIEDVNLTIDRGEFIGLIGHTGSGKSTLIQHLNGLLKPTGGQVLLDGRDIFSDKKFTRQVRFRVGLVFQYPEYQLFEETTYLDIAFGPKNMGLPEDEIRRRVYQAARFVGLKDEYLDKSPFALSGGQKRRVAIAGVIAMEPDLLILDEPTAGLDPEGRQGILENICTYRRQRGTAIVMVSHSMEEVAATADRLVVMSDGHVAMEGTPRAVFTRSDELQAMGLAVPQVTLVFRRLRELGLAVDASVFTLPQAVAALQALRKGAGNHA